MNPHRYRTEIRKGVWKQVRFEYARATFGRVVRTGKEGLLTNCKGLLNAKRRSIDLIREAAGSHSGFCVEKQYDYS